MGITRDNLQKRNIADKVRKLLSEYDQGNNKERTMKIRFHGHNTGHEVKITEEFFWNEKAKKEFVEAAEASLHRQIDIGTRHIYVGTKLDYVKF